MIFNYERKMDFELDPFWTPLDRGLYCLAFVGYIMLYIVWVNRVMAIPTPSIESFVEIYEQEEYTDEEKDQRMDDDNSSSSSSLLPGFFRKRGGAPRTS